ncbi:beta-ketoacyl-[acyl-carrier-protein] synthase family protein [Fuerstiella marisgermanici]|uniref:3-oxoacyl-[acyl-carrier-protein] synthase 2 n=1 Tax=Fuerstiella marisgermanici TaxID=1891926 RepID=A0A1P8WAN9_9PLAN|nr:beta-ketoacyl-[acyl-carrier-protein] synthase family protein [Fuerstiella marisgermanici]APZ91120.1 3-oxoacyl-[acyl-carrier-protein] synthase 2 [Fuerstiella marisgermanici]
MFTFNSDDSVDRHVVCTGIGMVTPLAIGREASWANLLNGDHAARPLRQDEIDHHSQLCDLLRRTPGGAIVDHAAVREAALSCSDSLPTVLLDDPLNSMIVVALVEAMTDAGLGPAELSPQRTGCIIGTSKASLRAMEGVTNAVVRGDIPNSGQWRNGFLSDGPLRAAVAVLGGVSETATPIAACATGLVSVIQAAALIRSGQCDVCVAGSADASLRASVLASFHRLGVTSKNSDPATACRPFDADRDGFVIGEGGAVFVLESAAHAEARGAKAYGKLLAGNWMTDPTGVTQVDTSGAVVADVVKPLVEASNIANAEPGFYCLHGTGTVSNDLAEANGLFTAVGRKVPAYGIKGAIGHLLGAAGSVEFATMLLALRDRTIPATLNLQNIDSKCPVGVSNANVETSADTATKLSLGFGGHVAAVVVSR